MRTDSGTSSASAVERWYRLHRLLPVLVAMFANSPFRWGAPSGWKSTRERVWMLTDPSRTSAVAASADIPAAWACYALDALVLCIRSDDGSWDAPVGLTMREWLQGHGPRSATAADLAYHLSTLFPPVRPRGFLELRVIDSQPGSGWETVVAVVKALMDDERAADAADAACSRLDSIPDILAIAAREGLSHPLLGAAAKVCAEAAVGALARLGADQSAQDRTEAFLGDYTLRRRSPADERLEYWQRTGSFISKIESEEER